jgi:3-oxoacyl-(acyl-carrier-protein) synthase
MERVVITGVGAVSALGLGADTNFAQALGGRSGIDLLQLPFAGHLTCGVVAQIQFAQPDLEFVLTIQALRAQAIPPMAFLEDPDAGCDLDFVPHQGHPNQRIRAAMSNSFAFGGSNVALVATPFANA